jgi:hypothetical protein
MPVPVAAPLPATRRSYWHDARAPRYSLTFAVPLFVLYELMAMVLSGGSGGLRNGADVLLKAPFLAAFGARGPLVFVGLLSVVCTWAILGDRKKGPIRGNTFVLMFAESLVLAAVFGGVIGSLTAKVLGPLQSTGLAVGGLDRLGIPGGVMVSLGAGLYEELLFRVVLVGTTMWGAKRLLGWGPVASGTLAIVGGALVFSAFHYIGAYGDPFAISSFTFRAIAGLAFSGLYVLRGFGITAWTHALYDILIVMFGGG